VIECAVPVHGPETALASTRTLRGTDDPGGYATAEGDIWAAPVHGQNWNSTVAELVRRGGRGCCRWGFGWSKGL